ncbi:arrestin domain-containing protein 17 isoform X2 [Culicoides brevitarsis]
MSRKLLKFLILFDNTSLLYFPGQFLSGRVLLELQDETPALGLHFHVVGEGVVRSKSVRQERVYDKESYIDFRMKLLGDVDQGSLSVLSPGIHSFPFKLGLPHGLPSTFLGRYGWIQYYCKAALREPSGLIHKNHQVFIVMNPIDLRLELGLASPFKCQIKHKLGVACFDYGTIECNIVLDRAAYVPGENILVSGTVANRSSIACKMSRAVLIETIQYFARGKVIKVEKRELAVKTRPKIRPHSIDEWIEEPLFVPPLPPTNLAGCHLMKIDYDVFFIVTPKSFEKEIKLQIPITLGTYPFDHQSNDTGSEFPESILKPETYYPSNLPIIRPWMHEMKSDPFH